MPGSAMTKTLYVFTTALLVASTLTWAPSLTAETQETEARGAATFAADTLSVEVKVQIRDYYAARPASGAKALPPGIRRNLQRGKPLPPGIAKKSVPAELRSRLQIREGFELLEVGLDVFLVEVATNLIHDVLRDILR
jgi:hypothetical protein